MANASRVPPQDLDLLSDLHDDRVGGGDWGNVNDPQHKHGGVGQEDAVTLTTLKGMLAGQTKTLLDHQQALQAELQREFQDELRQYQDELKRELQEELRQ
jgi:hypothetical protein